MASTISQKVEKPSRDEVINLIDSEAQRRLNLSATELVKRYQEGNLKDPSAVRDLIILLDLLSEDDPIFDARTTCCH